jgi:hypothetical protein
MKSKILAAAAVIIVIGTTFASMDDADAVVCARGVYRAGCAGPRGAVMVHRPHVYRPYVYRPYVHRRAVVVRPHRTVIVR